jgi:FAD synthase
MEEGGSAGGARGGGRRGMRSTPTRRVDDAPANTQEVHIMHPFKHDFYGHEMSVLVLGYIRPELDYISKGAPPAEQ